ncbi:MULTISPECIES: zinc-binding dehydrogenase [Streptomyces]|uniref:Oxidoreductase n=1 Tax=Streptomyces tsukubensis (strain DSM 42081 / NBRC 108919 / NRRL 18488 / 9993) TaxID=1114943 RepID=I2N0V0_STRT9|nr:MULTISPECIES: zinc-binding dehydrogenase [Streptomyces]AZK94839.1 oxidoreductase [Streptomyces tsukubensis]EIF90647.1 alcohol dehydrogenase zinc-binding domain-containing protein [Streptomyces tsukubensis NRRL18488]MYS66999.1 zinc-binding dehydrogenase [Streptomyces sp. SID5473]QKM69079.1 oxidoreductase [Streptomyces tsukubensis NRRL18488]TAI40698.1 oxidoreductase [Streptomyces tsukubensis]
MHAVRLHAFGPAENLTYEEVPDPDPGPGQVRIRVAAAGVHLIDTALRAGERGPYPEPVALPTIPGREVAGTVDALGEGTDPVWLGRRVVVHLGMNPGGYAESVTTGAERLRSLPEGLGAAEAVAMIGTGRTALGILHHARLGPEAIAVVSAAAGGIGTLAVQYAKNAGATVIGLAGGPAKVARTLANGADLAVDYTGPAWPDEVRAYLGERRATVYLDAVGGAVGRAAVGLLGKGGRHLVYGWAGDGGPYSGEPLLLTEEEQTARGIETVHLLGPRLLEQVGGDVRLLEDRALEEAATGRLAPAVQRFPLARAADAHRALETRASMGKVVLVP